MDEVLRLAAAIRDRWPPFDYLIVVTGFAPRPASDVARLADGKWSFSCCFGREAEAELARYGIYDLIAITTV